MNGLLSRLPGPFFDFLVTDGEHWERAGKVQRIIGIKQEYFNNPAALRVQDAIVGVVAGCFEKAHPSFNYYGPESMLLEELLSFSVNADRAPQLMPSVRHPCILGSTVEQWHLNSI